MTINSMVVSSAHLPCDSAILPYSWGSLTNYILIFAQCYFFLRGIGTEWKFNDIAKGDDCGCCSQITCAVISWVTILTASIVLAAFGTKGLVDQGVGCITTKLLVLCIISLVIQYSTIIIAAIALFFRAGCIKYEEAEETQPTDVRIQPSTSSGLPYKNHRPTDSYV